MKYLDEPHSATRRDTEHHLEAPHRQRGCACRATQRAGSEIRKDLGILEERGAVIRTQRGAKLAVDRTLLRTLKNEDARAPGGEESHCTKGS